MSHPPDRAFMEACKIRIKGKSIFDFIVIAIDEDHHKQGILTMWPSLKRIFRTLKEY